MPEIPALPGGLNSRDQGLCEAVAEAFAPGGTIAQTLPGFEARGAQRQMAAAVADVFEEGGVLLAEAGTGTGKTLAYLVPAILSRRRVLVSTGTKNLQEQIVEKDLPVLTRVVDRPFSVTVMKGRGNYLCRHRYQAMLSGSLPRQQRLGGFGSPGTDVDERILLPILERWVARTTTGDRAELRDLPEELPIWSELSASAENCLGTTCPQYHECYVTLMRQRAADSELVVVNHHLLFADAAVRQGNYGAVIPERDVAVLDEALAQLPRLQICSYVRRRRFIRCRLRHRLCIADLCCAHPRRSSRTIHQLSSPPAAGTELTRQTLQVGSKDC